MDRFKRIFAAPARVAEWVISPNDIVTVGVAKASEIPVPMPIDMVFAMVATVHRSFGVIFQNGESFWVYLGDKMMKASESSDISLQEATGFVQILEGLKVFLMEAEEKGLSFQGIEFGFELESKEMYFREVAVGVYRLVGNFADESQRKLALSALGSK